MPENDDLSLLITAARDAGKIALRHWQKAHEVWDKPDGAGPVTEADLAVDRMLRRTLTQARPDYGWLSEESIDDGSRLSRETCFVVDPIDGTRAFTAGEQDWAHSLAVVRNGVPVAAVIYMPARHNLYAAASGSGAVLNSTPISASARTDFVDAHVLLARPTLAAENWKTVPTLRRAFRSSLAYRMALIAQGKFDAMITLRPTWEWDIAAGALIATEAGARVTTRTGAALRFNNPTPQTDGVLCTAPGLHSQIIDQLA